MGEHLYGVRWKQKISTNGNVDTFRLTTNRETKTFPHDLVNYHVTSAILSFLIQVHATKKPDDHRRASHLRSGRQHSKARLGVGLAGTS